MIRANKKPEHRADLRLVVNAGSVLETRDQAGLAHFVEHMAFNGTKNFNRQALVNYLESVGVRFGPELNAFTGFDETEYLLQVPTDTGSILERGFDILEDWAHQVTFEGSEIDKERGVIIEEWRLGRGASARISDKQLPILLKNSRYAERLPIGSKENLETFRHDTLRAFYRTWYRPDLMAVIAVGDFDPAAIEALIAKHFSVIPADQHPVARPVYPIPPHRDTLFAIATDKELTSQTIGLTVKLPAREEGTTEAYRLSLLEQITNALFNNRLAELVQMSDPPFVAAFAGKGDLVRGAMAFRLNAMVRETGFERGFGALLTESARAARYGFTDAELDRVRKNTLRSYEQAFQERDKTESRGLADEYVRHYLTGEPVPGIAYEYDLAQQMLPTFTSSEASHLWKSWLNGQNVVVTVAAPEKPGLRVPTEGELRRLMDSVAHSPVTAYIDTLSARPLLPSLPPAGSIVAEKEIQGIGVTEWTLSNGARVYLKPSDFKNDEILVRAFSPGGTSLAPDQDFTAAATAPTVVQQGGLGTFDLISLQKALAGKIVSTTAYIDEQDEGLSGSTSPKDLETFLELLHLTFTSPRRDSIAFASLMNRMRAVLQNRGARPEAALQDTNQVTVAQYHPRRRPMTVDMLKEFDLDRSLRFYRERFGDASDFTFLLVGSFTLDQMRPLVSSYIANLPALHRHERWRDVGVSTPAGIVKKEIRKGIEPKSQVILTFTGPLEWTVEGRIGLNALTEVLRIKLREVLREDKGGTYGVSVQSALIHYPAPESRFAISFGCAPDRVDELLHAVFSQVDSLRGGPIDGSYITKVKELLRRTQETQLKQNSFWISALHFYLWNSMNPEEIPAYEKRVQLIRPELIRTAATAYLNPQRFVQVVLYPEGEKK
jgi:zinc protease